MQIVEWYDELERLTGSPVVRLNRAVAVGEADGPRAAWRRSQRWTIHCPATPRWRRTSTNATATCRRRHGCTPRRRGRHRPGQPAAPAAASRLFPKAQTDSSASAGSFSACWGASIASSVLSSMPLAMKVRACSGCTRCGYGSGCRSSTSSPGPARRSPVSIRPRSRASSPAAGLGRRVVRRTRHPSVPTVPRRRDPRRPGRARVRTHP